ncbi:MAG: pantoate--beta-alanine ligase [Pirellulales bacterium]|nr:pantoate--beta-alanine ligase [Pirellulales bacterium]
MSSPRLITSVAELREISRAAKFAGQTVGLIPTMGALHAGHVSLVAAAAQSCQCVIVSIFVNPTQFAPHEDLQKYPRDLAADLQLLAPHHVAAVFAPTVEQMYPANFQTAVTVQELSQPWEGVVRPTHFSGVATVVLKLFLAAEPDYAYFGQKDYQQLAVIRQMTADLALPVQIVGCPIIRDADGLALSSRNQYLTAEQREQGLALSRALGVAAEMVQRGERDGAELSSALHDILASADLTVDYAVIVDATTLAPLARLDRPAVALVAARVGSTRLIDNRLLDPMPAPRVV